MQPERGASSETPLSEESTRPGLEIAHALQDLRERMGSPSLGAIRERTRIPKTTLHDLLTGNRTSRPRWEVIKRIITALAHFGDEAGLPVDEDDEIAQVHSLWKAVGHDANPRDKENSPELDLMSALKELYMRAGRPSFRRLSQYSNLPSSTLHDAISGHRASVPRWGILKSVVTALMRVEPLAGVEGDLDSELRRFHSLWQREYLVESRTVGGATAPHSSAIALNAVLGERAARALADIKKINGFSDAEAINRALLIAQFIDKSMAEGFEFFMQRPGDESRKIVIP